MVQAQLKSLTPEHPVERRVNKRLSCLMAERRWLAWLNYAFFDDQGRVREFQGVGRDITRRKEAEEALRESELRFRMYTEGSLVGVHVTQDDRFIYVNPVFAQIFGYSPQELMAGKGPLDLVHPDDRDFIRQKIAERLAGIPSGTVSFQRIEKRRRHSSLRNS